MSEHMDLTVQEPLRDLVGRAIAEEPPKNGAAPIDWYSLHEERREPWREDADRAIDAVARYLEQFEGCAPAVAVLGERRSPGTGDQDTSL